MLSSELLGFPPDARVLIVNADDLGMDPAVNAGVVAAVEDGIATSCSLMAPCPGAEQAMRLLRERQHVPFGIHLTLVRDHPDDRWAPVAPARDVPTLVDAATPNCCAPCHPVSPSGRSTPPPPTGTASADGAPTSTSSSRPWPVSSSPTRVSS